jgi:hypothetical protein
VYGAAESAWRAYVGAETALRMRLDQESGGASCP